MRSLGINVADDAVATRQSGDSDGVRPVELDLSENNTTLGVPRAVLEAMWARARTDDGIDPEAGFASAVSKRDGVPPDWILPGNGSLEMIHHVCRAFLKPGDRAVILGPTFGEFRLAVEAAGAIAVEFVADEAQDYRWDMSSVVRLVSVVRPAVVFLCNPNNPTGAYLSRDSVGAIREALGDGLLVVDEAYGDFLDDRWEIPEEWFVQGRLVVLRSVSKICSMQFLGLGYAVARPDLLAPVGEARQPGRLSAVTAAGGIAYLRDPGIAAGLRAVLREGKKLLVAGLSGAGYRVVTGPANFVMVRVGDARRARWELMRQAILVKDLESYGLPEYLRVATPAPAEVARVVRAFAGLKTASPA
jgi:histidinol-phosphate/aromatic aminotransferase/cobyric acid decarboxylase-like protein